MPAAILPDSAGIQFRLYARRYVARQMRPEGVRLETDNYYDLHKAVRAHIRKAKPYFGYFAGDLPGKFWVYRLWQ